jgi:excisionase family DNA binding protein
MEEKAMPDEWVQVGEAAKILGVARKQVDRLIRAGRLSFVRLPERYRFKGVYPVYPPRGRGGDGRERLAARDEAEGLQRGLTAHERPQRPTLPGQAPANAIVTG